MIDLYAAGPMEQFEIVKLIPLSLGSLDISFTNSALWMVIGVSVATAFFVFAARGRARLGEVAGC